MATTYTPQQMAEISQRYPGIEWVNGQPYTRQQAPSTEGVLDYLGNPAVAEETNTLVPAHTTEGRFPWEFIAAQVALPFAVEGIGALGGLGGGGSAAAAPSLSAPVTLGAPAVGSVGGTVIGGGGLGAVSAGAPAVGTVGGTTLGSGALSAPTAAGGGMDWGSIVRAGVDMGRGALQSQVDGRTQQDSRALTQDQLRIIIAQQEAANQQARAQTQIQQQTAAQQEQNNAYQNAVRASMVQAAQDFRVDRSQFSSNVPTISFSPGMRTQLGEGAQTAAATLGQQSQQRLENPSAQEALPTYTAPTLSQPTEQSIWEKLLGPVTAAGGAYTGLRPTTQAPGAQSITGGR